MPDGTIESLLQSERELDDWQLVTRYAPLIQFDIREPFLPDAAGYTIFHSDAQSSSFPRNIFLTTELYRAALAIEYAIWWDWDIEHLYELEHIWVYLDDQGSVVYCEASWHGGFHAMTSQGNVSVQNDKVIVFSEPGKHAFAPEKSWFQIRLPETLNACHFPGRGGVWVTPLFEGIIHAKTEENDALVRRYLQGYTFEPTFDFSKASTLSQDMLVPWPALYDWIPHRVDWCLKDIARDYP